MVELELSIGSSLLTATGRRRSPQKKTGAVEHPKVFDHAGLLANEPPGQAGLPFI